MLYTVIGTDSHGRKFAHEVFAACPREAEVYWCLKAHALNQRLKVAAVYDPSQKELATLDLATPHICTFPELLEQLEWHLSAGKVTARISDKVKWLHEVNAKELADEDFFYRAERLLNLVGEPDSVSANIREKLAWLAGLGLGLLGSAAIPHTLASYDLMYQARAAATLYGPVMRLGFTDRQLKIVAVR